MLKTVKECEREYYKKQPLEKKIRYKFWSIYYYFQIRLITFLRNLTDKIDRI